jgi:hypothetical protein
MCVTPSARFVSVRSPPRSLGYLNYGDTGITVSRVIVIVI